MKKKFPKKAKLITFGGFYKIIKIQKFNAVIKQPFTTKVELTLAELSFDDLIIHDLIFHFYRVHGGYAEYRQYDFVRIVKI